MGFSSQIRAVEVRISNVWRNLEIIIYDASKGPLSQLHKIYLVFPRSRNEDSTTLSPDPEMSIPCAASTIRTIRRAVLAKVDLPIADLPAFLCPGLLRIRPSASSPRTRNFATKAQPPQFQGLTTSQRRAITTTSSSNVLPAPPSTRALEKLPRTCPGCGAYSQFVDKEEAGFYTLTRKTIKEFLGTNSSRDTSAEDAIVRAALKNTGSVPAGLFFEEPRSGMNKPTPFRE